MLYEKKTRESLRNLRRNTIYYLDEHTSREEAEIECHSNIKCDCYKCNYEKFNFYKALENLENVNLLITVKGSKWRIIIKKEIVIDQEK